MRFPFQWWTPQNNGYSQMKLATLWDDFAIAQKEIISLQFFALSDVQILSGFLGLCLVNSHKNYDSTAQRLMQNLILPIP